MTSTGPPKGGLYVPDIEEDDDTLTAALKYARAGFYVGPLEPGTKHPGSILGNGWPAKTSRDTQVITSWFAGRMQGIGLFLHVGRSGALVLDVDYPEKLPPDLVGMLDADARRPYQSTRPDCPGRGHYLFLQPEGRCIGNGTGKLGAGWGDVRGLNGVIVVAPTPHPDGGAYRWQKGGALGHLPDFVLEQLTDASPAADAATDQQVERFLNDHTTSDRRELLGAAVRRFRQSADAEGGSRHGAMMSVVCWAARECRMGFYVARMAHDTLQAEFIEAMKPSIGSERAPSLAAVSDEFAGMFAWAVAQANALTEVELTERRAKTEQRAPERSSLHESTPEPVERVGVRESDEDDDVESDTAEIIGPTLLPDEFWSRRPILQHIRDAAHCRTGSGDLLLHAVLARLSAYIPHTYELPAPVGSPSALNFYSLVVGRSGTGKSTGVRVAKHLLEQPTAYEVMEVPLGSGEGISEMYMGFVKDGDRKVRQQVRHNAFIYIDEGESLIEQAAGRTGSTLGPTLRSAWAGEQIGQQNATEDRTRIIRQGQYNLGLVAGFQEELLAGLLRGGVMPGTLQRFMWVMTTDPSIPDVRPADPGPLALPRISGSVLAEHAAKAPTGGQRHYGRHRLGLADEITAELQDERLRIQRLQLQLDPIEAHRPLSLLKAAGLLAILDGRMDISMEDWELAKMMWVASCNVRETVIAKVRRHEERTEAGRIRRNATRARVEQVARSRAVSDVERLSRLLAEHVHLTGDEGITRKPLRGKLNGINGDRQLFDDAMNVAIEHGWVSYEARRYYPGEPLAESA